MNREQVAWSIAAGLLLALVATVQWGREGRQSGEAVVVSVDVAAYEARVRAAEIAVEGWRARFEGVRRLAADTVYVVDTLLVEVPDTVLTFAAIDERGSLTVELLTRVDSTVLRRPSLSTGIVIPNCDDGLYIGASGVRCDPARFGHAYANVTLARTPSVGLSWTPHYRSPWEIDATYDVRGRLDVQLRRGLRLW